MEPMENKVGYSTETFHSSRQLEDLRIQKKTVQEQLEAAEKKFAEGKILNAEADAFMRVYEDRLQE